MNSVFVGAGGAIITPFDKDGQIDFERFSKLIEFQITNKTDAIIVCGTTGEGSTLSVKERLDLFSHAVRQVNGKVPVIGGTGSNSSFFTLDLAKEAEKTGIDAHLMVTPYYNKTSQQGLIKHYTFLADRLQKPIFIYNVPSRTGMNIQPETYEKLSHHKNIAGVKEADGNIAKLTKSIALCKDRLDFYIGNDDQIAVSAYLGCKGVISVLSNILPKFTGNIVKTALKGEIAKANKLQSDALELIEALFSDVNPIPIKTAMKILGYDIGYLRGPLCEMSHKASDKLEEVLYKYQPLLTSENRKDLL